MIYIAIAPERTWPRRSRIRSFPVSTLALVLGVALVLGAAHPGGAAAGQPVTIPFPRLGMYSPNSHTQSARCPRRATTTSCCQAYDIDHIADYRASTPT